MSKISPGLMIGGTKVLYKCGEVNGKPLWWVKCKCGKEYPQTHKTLLAWASRASGTARCRDCFYSETKEARSSWATGGKKLPAKKKSPKRKKKETVNDGYSMENTPRSLADNGN
jgi:hypothetical protein